MAKDTGGPAFPSAMLTVSGMTLRDYFAAQAMMGLLVRVREPQWLVQVVTDAYKCADAMLAERAK